MLHAEVSELRTFSMFGYGSAAQSSTGLQLEQGRLQKLTYQLQ